MAGRGGGRGGGPGGRGTRPGQPVTVDDDGNPVLGVQEGMPALFPPMPRMPPPPDLTERDEQLLKCVTPVTHPHCTASPTRNSCPTMPARYRAEISLRPACSTPALRRCSLFDSPPKAISHPRSAGRLTFEVAAWLRSVGWTHACRARSSRDLAPSRRRFMPGTPIPHALGRHKVLHAFMVSELTLALPAPVFMTPL